MLVWESLCGVTSAFSRMPARVRLQITLKAGRTCAISHCDVGLDLPRLPLRCMPNPAGIVSPQPVAQVIRYSDVEPLRIDFALQDVNVRERHELATGLPGRSSPTLTLQNQRPGFAFSYAAADFVRHLRRRAKPGGEGS